MTVWFQVGHYLILLTLKKQKQKKLQLLCEESITVIMCRKEQKCASNLWAPFYLHIRCAGQVLTLSVLVCWNVLLKGVLALHVSVPTFSSEVPRRAPRSLQLFGSLIISTLPNPFTTSQILSSSLSSSNAPVTLGNLLFLVHCYSLYIVSQHWWETLGFIYLFFHFFQLLKLKCTLFFKL